MTNDGIDNTICSAILLVHKKNNGGEIDSIYKQIIENIDFEDVTKEFPDDIIHILVNNEKIIYKTKHNADSYYINSRLELFFLHRNY